MNRISIQDARRFVLEQNRLTGAAPRASTLEVVQHLGYVQIDTISVVERAHHHTIWSRQSGYEPKQIDVLQRERKVFEYWSHAASYLPMEAYRFCLPKMRRYREGKSHWFNSHPRERRRVLDRIRAEGPLSSGDFEAPAGHRGGSWFEWKPAKRALEQLFMAGELMVSHRTGFRKIYDLPERVLPTGLPTSLPSPVEHGRWLTERALTAQGLASLREMAYLRTHDRASIKLGLRELLEEGTLIQFEIDGIDDEVFFALKTDWERFQEIPSSRAADRKARFLSPFDNLMIQRKRVKRLFEFDYMIECYTPEAKRKYGYFCLPVLWENQFVGRVDLKADRAKRELILKEAHFERGFQKRKAVQKPLSDALLEFARFNGCDSVRSLLR